MKRTEMDNIVENMAEYICDHICQKPKEITDAEKLEDYCAEECDMNQPDMRAEAAVYLMASSTAMIHWMKHGPSGWMH